MKNLPIIELPYSDDVKIIIKKYLKKLDWKISKLAKLSGVSHSMINQILSGRKRPSYETATKLFNTLIRNFKESTGKALNIATKDLKSITPDKKVSEAIKLMKGVYDQIPVIDKNGANVGSITTNLFVKFFDEKNLKDKQISEIMEPALPVIDEESDLTVVKRMLTIVDAVLISKRGKIKGIITKSDLIKKIT